MKYLLIIGVIAAAVGVVTLYRHLEEINNNHKDDEDNQKFI